VPCTYCSVVDCELKLIGMGSERMVIDLEDSRIEGDRTRLDIAVDLYLTIV
jgi:hypothetical protein